MRIIHVHRCETDETEVCRDRSQVRATQASSQYYVEETERERSRRARGPDVAADTSWIVRIQGSTVTSTNAGMLSAPFLSVTRNLKLNSFVSETKGARKDAFGMLRSKRGTFAPRTWLQV